MIRRRFPIPTLLSLTLAGACAPGKGEIEAEDGDVDSGGEGDSDWDEDTGTDPDALPSIEGGWLLESWSGYELEYSYTYGECTYNYAYVIRMEFGEEAADGLFSGRLTQSYTYNLEGEDCEPYYEDYGDYGDYYYYSYGAEARRSSERKFDITLYGWALEMECRLETDDQLVCDFRDGGDTGESVWVRD